MNKYLFRCITIVSLLFTSNAMAQGEDKITVMSKITCECIDNISDKVWESDPKEEIEDCFNAAVLGGLLSLISLDSAKETDSIVVEIGSNKVKNGDAVINEINESDLELTKQQLRKNCDRYIFFENKGFKALTEKALTTSCSCISKISTSIPLEEKNAKIQKCMVESVSKETSNGEARPVTVEEIQSFYSNLQTQLVENCEAINRVTFSEDEHKLNSYSSDKKASLFYSKGQTAYKAKKIKEAIRYYKKAVTIDKNFVFAWDNLGRSYRELNQFDKAIEAYEASLKVDKFNKTALMNIAVAYNYKKDFENSIKYYELLKSYYPKDPESPYGLALAYMQKGNLEKSLLNAIEAYELYQQAKSPYQADAKRLMNYLYTEFNKADKSKTFKRICAENNITIKFE
ncbi:MAG: tetratricopeptide repeat protein [Algibacter sp.]